MLTIHQDKIAIALRASLQEILRIPDKESRNFAIGIWLMNVENIAVSLQQFSANFDKVKFFIVSGTAEYKSH